MDRIGQEEIFGPVLSVIPVDDYGAAMLALNQTRYGLSSSIFTRDVNTAFRAMRDFETGIVYVNAGTTGAEVHLPFGGWKETGNGHREAGHVALDTYTEWKSIYVDFCGRLQRAQIDNQPATAERRSRRAGAAVTIRDDRAWSRRAVRGGHAPLRAGWRQCARDRDRPSDVRPTWRRRRTGWRRRQTGAAASAASSQPGSRRGHHDLLAGVEDLVGGERPARLLGARIGDGQHAQRAGVDQRRREPALEPRALRDAEPGEQDDPLVADRDRRDHLGADRGRGERRRGQVRDAPREADAEALLDAHRELRVVQPDDDAQVGPGDPRVERHRQVDEVVAGGRDDRPGGAEVEFVEDLGMARVADDTGMPAARVGDTNRPSSLTSTTTTGTPRAAMPSATRYPIEPSPATMTWSWMSPGTVRRPSVWRSRERMSASVMNA